MNEMVFPWDIDQQALKYAWPVSFIKNRRMPTLVWEAPADRTLDQAVKLLRFLQGSRNWVVCFSMSPSYMRTLYTYVEALWVCLLYTSDAADDLLCVDLGGRRIIQTKTTHTQYTSYTTTH